MTFEIIIIGLASVLSIASPIVIAAIGETYTERAGIINLSANGTILLTAMAGFGFAVKTESVFVGMAAGALLGGFVALIIAFSSIYLKRSQVAVGFVLTLLTADLAYFLGSPFMGISGPRIYSTPIPVLSEIPVIGTLFFNHNIMVYVSFLIIIFSQFYFYKTGPGLILRGIGDNPQAAFVRGANVNRLRYLYTFLGGAMIGLAGPMYSLGLKAGWKGTISGLDGIGWIALAITIFGGWDPLKVALGAYFFALLQWLGIFLQPYLPNIPSQVLQVAPFPLMILTLLFVKIGDAQWIEDMLVKLPEKPRQRIRKLINSLQNAAPSALGSIFERK